MKTAEMDRSVAALLEDQNEAGRSSVAQTIRYVLSILDDNQEMDYCSKVRVLTKSLAIINERQRVRLNEIEDKRGYDS